MALTIDTFTTGAQMDAIYDWCIANNDPTYLCSPGAAYPDRHELIWLSVDPFIVYVAHDGPTLFGFVIVDGRQGRVLWLKYASAQVKTTMRLLLGAVRVDHPQVWGVVRNSVVRNALLANGCSSFPEGGTNAVIWTP